MNSQSGLNESKVIEILELLSQRVPHRTIAKLFSISTKTVSRINSGETWQDVSMRYNRKSLSGHVNLPKQKMVSISPEVADSLDELTAIKNHFGLDFKHPIHWGWFDGWDGKHSVVSDGYIIWESADLVTYAKKLSDTGIEGSPFYACSCEELPTFELEDIMTMPVGHKYSIDTTAGDIVRLSGGKEPIYLRQKYVNIAMRMKLELRAAGKSGEYVYLTRNKPKSVSDPLPIVIACVVTIKEKLI